jgi:hypothetical protein
MAQSAGLTVRERVLVEGVQGGCGDRVDFLGRRPKRAKS